VKDILKKTLRSIDQVTLQPDGKWELNAKKENMNNSRSSRFDSDSDDDLIEVTKTGDSVRMGTPQILKTPANAVFGQSREVSLGSTTPMGSTSGKRPIGDVIDLTSSGDEDEPPQARPAKRPFHGLNGAPPSLPAYLPPPLPYVPR
jgi:E3 SUMO-protein ligase PIAS1